MKYLVRKTGSKNKAHYWTGNDTFCRMASTGGIMVSRFGVYDNDCNREICFMCKNRSKFMMYAEFINSESQTSMSVDNSKYGINDIYRDDKLSHRYNL